MMNALEVLAGLPDIRRAWPGKDGSLSFEQIDVDGRLRAGLIVPDGSVSLADFGRDDKLSSLHPPGPGERLVVHRYHRRAVSIGPDRVQKYLRAGRATQIARLTTNFGRLCSMVGLGSAQVLAVTSDQVDFSILPGTTLHDLGPKGAAGWAAFAVLWPDLARRELSVPEHLADAEAAVLEHWMTMVERFDALPNSQQLRRAVDHTTAELLKGAADTPVLLHRDLHDKQLMWDGSTLSVLDVDTAACGEAALDAGNLLAHAELRRIQGIFDSTTYSTVVAQAESVAAALGASPVRLATYRRAAMLRLACVYAFRPGFARHQSQWIELCLQA